MYVIYVNLFVLGILDFEYFMSYGKYRELVVKEWLVVEFVVNIVSV